ncbi:MAG: CRISPR-associated helicase Cas3', partial [Actinobacteria bacterium]|nr:CRISPR-associated helicase Cas3' [Actinomycetota bacterium]
DMTSLIGTGPWVSVQDALLDRAAVRAGLDLARLATVRLPQAVQMLLTGVVVMADWIASGDTFPLLPVEQVPAVPPVEAPVSEASERAARGLREVRLGRPWTPSLEPADVDGRFVDRFPWALSGPRPVQRAVVEAAATMTAPGLLVLEAPMGVGKTEAAFMAAEVLAARTGASGCFVALPTQATSNAMFARMLAWLERLPDGAGVGAQSVALVHGKAALNDDLARLPFGIRDGAPLYDEDTEDSATRRVRAVLGEWTRGRKQAALSAFVVGTIDQVLFAALRARHTMLRHLSLAGKVVVVDEVHAADVYMSAFLERALEWLAAEGTSVLLMSATLPAARRSALYVAYERGRRRRLGEEPDDLDQELAVLTRLGGDIGYPSVVVTGEDGPQVLSPPAGSDGRAVRLHQLDDDLESLTALLLDRLADGGCAVVVRNTVRRAQETARHLSRVFGEEQVSVAHAGFLAADRVATDRGLLARFGPPGDRVTRPVRHVVVATQVVEQSLDVDFDLMVSDFAPIDLVLQRLGRLHRHRRGPEEQDRPVGVREAECYLTGVDWTATPPTPVSGSCAVYGRWLLYAGLAVVQPHLDGLPVRLPSDISSLVQTAYADDVPVPDGWEDAMAEARVRFLREQQERVEVARTFALEAVLAHGRDLYDSGRGGAGTIDEDSPQAQGYVRDGGDSIEVVVVQRGDGQDRVPDWVEGGGESLPLRDYPVPPDQARRLARCTLRLPYALTVPGVADQVIADLEQNWFGGWQRTPYLSGQLALVLDEHRRAEVAGHHLTYDLRLGLVVDGDDL